MYLNQSLYLFLFLKFLDHFECYHSIHMLSSVYVTFLDSSLMINHL